ncbi:MAG: hypothetical protein GY950_22990, partial [bacterium]|nr:hypothetical protein [bacterium]
LSIEEPVPQELQLTALIKAHGELEKKKKDLGLLYIDKGDILAEKEDELEETRRSSKRNQLKKEIEETKTEVADLETQIRSLQVEINGAKKAVEREKALISQSTNMTEGLEMFSGETVNTKVTAKVTLKNDEVKNYIFLLRKDTLTLGDRQTVGRIIVIKLMAVEDFEKAMKEKEEKVEEKTEEVTEEAPVTEEKTSEG